MDSLTQFALGATVGVAVLGRRAGPRRAALAGGVLGTLPDLDVLYTFKDPVDAFVLHRGPTHSLFVQTLVTPLFGEVLNRLIKPLRGARFQTWLAVWLCFTTHALLDALTVYGTRIFWPVWPEPVGVGSIFIIDPLYTLPLLVVVIWAFCLSSWTSRLKRAVVVGLVFTTGYLGWGLLAQRITEARASALLRDDGLAADRVLATPTPFNSLLWRVIALDGHRYFNLYLPVFDSSGEAIVYDHPRGQAYACIDQIDAAARLARFSKGFFRTELVDGLMIVSDLRMGLTPNYAFRFAVAKLEGDALVPIPPERVRGERSAAGDLDWLASALLGVPPVRSAEAAAVIDPQALETPAQEDRRAIC